MAFDPSLLRVMAITDALEGQNDRLLCDSLINRAVLAAEGGATSIQVRLKGVPSRVVVDVTRAIIERVRIPVLVNDRFDIALAAGAAGVHVGADDISVADVRRVTPPGFIIGTSVGCEAEVPNSALADFVGIGPVFHTSSKSDAGPAIGIDGLSRLAAATGKPTIAIGGIHSANAASVFTDETREAGVVGIAVVSAIFSASDPRAAAQTLRTLVDRSFSTRLPHS
jgi:thiamine-phosphate pyrophosphorylase